MKKLKVILPFQLARILQAKRMTTYPTAKRKDYEGIVVLGDIALYSKQ